MLTLAIVSGNLQTVVFIEIVMNLFETMDILLGLPEEFRMSKRRTQQRGLLNAPEFLDLTISILQKADKMRPEHAQGGVKALRKQIQKIRRLLRERFHP